MTVPVSKKSRRQLEIENEELRWEKDYYKEKSANQASALSHRDKAVMKPQTAVRTEDMIDRSLFKFCVSHEDQILDETSVNVIPSTCIIEEKKLFHGPGHLASVNKFFSIRGESMLGRSFNNTTHQGDTQVASHEQKCLSFIGRHKNIVIPVTEQSC